MTATLTPHARSVMAHNPIEARIVRRVIHALRTAGTPVTSVYDGGEETPARSETDILNIVFNLDEAWLVTDHGSWVRIILGNEWDALIDYTIDLSTALTPVNDWIQQNW